MAEPARLVDKIDVAPRFDADDVARLNARFEDTDTADMIAAVLREGLLGRVAAVSSFGAESAVLLHLLAQADPSVPVLFINTGKHFPQTLDYRDQLVAQLHLTGLYNVEPEADVVTEKDETGLRWSYDPDGCCEIRKVLPLERVMAGFDASITGRKGFQSATRAGLQYFELDGGRIKFNPLARWDKTKIDAYMAEHHLPPHPLVEAGYPSIGCAPCTSRVQPGEDPRAGRWRGWDKVECGIHSAVPVGADDGDEPVF